MNQPKKVDIKEFLVTSEQMVSLQKFADEIPYKHGVQINNWIQAIVDLNMDKKNVELLPKNFKQEVEQGKKPEIKKK